MVLGNLLLGAGPIGMSIDYATGDMWRHNKHYMFIDLRSLKAAPDVVNLKLPIKVTYPNGAYDTVIVPVSFHKVKDTTIKTSLATR